MVRRLIGFLSVVLFLTLSADEAHAQVTPEQPGQSRPSVATQTQPRPQPLSDARVPLLEHPVTLSDFPDMKPRPELRDKLAHLTQFIQNSPVDGAPATEATEVYLGRTGSALYIVFVCFDRHPELIRTHLARRENILKDDYVTVNLDPFQDRQRGVEFQVNPNGVQADATWTEANGADYSYDQVWDSDGRITRKGWMALIAIPFRSLRFPLRSNDWGVVFWRTFRVTVKMTFGRGSLRT